MKTYEKLFLALIGSMCFSNILGATNGPPKLPQHSQKGQEERKELSFGSPRDLSAFLKTLGKGSRSEERLLIRMHIPDDSKEQQAEIKFNLALAPNLVKRIILHRHSGTQSNVFFENIPTIQYCGEDGNLGEEIQLSLIDQQAQQGIIIREKDAGTLFVYIPVYHDAYKQGLSTFTFNIKQLTPGTSYQISLGYELSPEGVPTKAICSLEPIQGQECDVSVQDTIDLDPNSYII
jgi:hypothetical protein